MFKKIIIALMFMCATSSTASADGFDSGAKLQAAEHATGLQLHHHKPPPPPPRPRPRQHPPKVVVAPIVVVAVVVAAIVVASVGPHQHPHRAH